MGLPGPGDGGCSLTDCSGCDVQDRLIVALLVWVDDGACLIARGKGGGAWRLHRRSFGCCYCLLDSHRSVQRILLRPCTPTHYCQGHGPPSPTCPWDWCGSARGCCVLHFCCSTWISRIDHQWMTSGASHWDTEVFAATAVDLRAWLSDGGSNVYVTHVGRRLHPGPVRAGQPNQCVRASTGWPCKPLRCPVMHPQHRVG